MSGDKHTPGPWSVCGGMTPAYAAIHSASGYIVYGLADASVHMEHGALIQAPSMDEQRANARLIAAAPDLLEALENLFESYKSLADSGDAGFWALEDLEEGQAAIAAIRKAKGAFDPAPPKYPDKALPDPVDHVSGQRIRERERRY